MNTNLTPMNAGRLAWYARRLGSMTLEEILWRACRLTVKRLPRRALSFKPTFRLFESGFDWDIAADRFRNLKGRPLLLDRSRAELIKAQHPEQVAALVTAAERVRAGYVTYFGYPEVRLTNPIDWNHDPIHDFQWPLRDASRIDHRVARADPKWIWELNRLQHLPTLAQAWLFTGDDTFAEVALDHLDSWMDQNPVGRGIAWRGAFEVGVRAISVALALQGLRDSAALTPQLFKKSVRMLAASADLCWRDRSRFSSANNHLVGELAGLATVAMLFPELASAKSWEERALRALNIEASRQILPDGASAEQAIGYQLFTAELLMVVSALIESRGDVPPAAIRAAIEKSGYYLAAVVGQDDPDPRYGDDDEGFALRLGPEPRRTVRDHLGIVAALTGNDRTRRVGRTTLSAAWMAAITGASLTTDRDSVEAPPASMVAPHGGLVVLRSGARRLTMDVGPLGFLSIAAHGHADALAVTLSMDGQDVIGDPGAASYYGHPSWRRVHRSTRVHGTVTVDGESQSRSGGPFMWSEHAQVHVWAMDLARGIVDAEHDGYRRLADSVTHRRWLFVAPGERSSILVVDEVSGAGQHEMRVSWPLHPSLDVGMAPDGYLITRDGAAVVQIAMVAAANVTLDHVRGDEQGHLGWWSERLEARVPSWLLGGVARGSVPLVMASIICSSEESRSTIADPAISRVEDKITTSWSSLGYRHTAVIDRSRPGAVAFRSLPLA